MRLGIIDLGRMGANMVQQLQDYMETFEEALSATSTAWAPGYVIPADHKWVARFKAALEADYVVLVGGNARKLGDLPPGARLGNNANAFIGGFRLWKDT